MRVLITGAAGFIGSALTLALLDRGDEVIGVDNLNDYYEPRLKHARLARQQDRAGYTDVRADTADRAAVERLFEQYRPQRVVHLAGFAGVRHSIRHPELYVASNIDGFATIIDAARRHGVDHFVYASSSSVYGANARLPYAVDDPVDHPMSLYAATKKANELMAHTYSHLFGLPTTGLRFFTVYGPWGRPDMAYFLFARKILAGEPIEIFNHGNCRRDFTYIDDIVEGLVRVLDKPAQGDPEWRADAPTAGSSDAPYRIYNMGNHVSTPLPVLVETLERLLGRAAEKRLLPAQPGDVTDTCADIGTLVRDFGFAPATPLEEGLARFVEWFRGYEGG